MIQFTVVQVCCFDLRFKRKRAVVLTAMALHLFDNSPIGQVYPVRMIPIVEECVFKALDDVIIGDLDGQFAAFVEASRRQIDRADNRPPAVGQ